ncbi:MAG: preprotein translocase subunit SecE [Sciscionella sp.]
MTETRPARTSGGGTRDNSERTSISLFIRQIVAELRKVIWPTRDQLSTYFAVTLVFVCVLIALVALLDYGFNSLMFQIFG